MEGPHEEARASVPFRHLRQYFGELAPIGIVPVTHPVSGPITILIEHLNLGIGPS